MKYFDKAEFTMDGVNMFRLMDPTFLALLDMCRGLAGVPFVITSSFRTVRKNLAVSGSSNSLHMQGRAVDVSCTNGEARAKIIKAALSVGLSVGVMKNGLHLDDRDVQIVFHYYDQ